MASRPTPAKTAAVAPGLGRLDLALALLAGLLSLALYTRTLAAWLLPGDSGEFQVLVYQLGIAHTTGYPVYMLLGKLFITLFPIGEIAYRVNFFSAVMAAATVGLVYAGGKLLSGSRLAALGGALALAVSFTFWSQAIIAEVYTPGAAFLAAVWVGLLAWRETGRPRPLFVAGLCGGLGLGVHASLGFAGPAAGLFLLLHHRCWRTLWKPALGGLLAGLILYLAIFAAVELNAPAANIFNAAYGPARSAWSLTEADMANPVTRMIFIGTGRQWRTALFPDPTTMSKRFAEYAGKLPREFTLLGLGLAGLGLLTLFWRQRRTALLFTAALVINWLFCFNYHTGDIYVFYIPGYVLIAMLIAAGLAVVERTIGLLRWRGVRAAQVVVVVGLAGSAIWPVVAPRLPAVQAGQPPFIGAREYLVNAQTAGVHKIAADTVKGLPPNAIVFTDWHWLYPYYYVAHIEMDRGDLRFIETFSRSDRGGLPGSVVEFVQAEFGGRPIYFSRQVGEIERAGFALRPVMAGPTRLFQVQYR